jgi:hypothetical protein
LTLSATRPDPHSHMGVKIPPFYPAAQPPKPDTPPHPFRTQCSTFVHPP